MDMLINNNLPDSILEAFYRILDKLPDQIILDISKREPKFIRGHRNIRENVGIVRNQLKVSLKKEGYLSQPLNIFLCHSGLSQDVVVVLSEKAIEQCFENLAMYFGEADFLAAMLLDKRPFVYGLANNFITTWDGQDSDEVVRKLSLGRLQERLRPFISIITLFGGDDAVKPKTDLTAIHEFKSKLDKLDQKVKSNEKNYTQLEKRSNRDNKDNQQEIALKQKEIVRLQTALKTSKDRSADLQSQLLNVQEGLVSSHSTEEQRIQASIDLAIKSTLRQWLSPLIELDEVVTGNQTHDVLERAKSALVEQQAVDRKYGNIILIEEMIDARRKMLSEINNAKRTALKPIPVLNSIAVDLEKEINDLEIKIDRTRILPEVVSNLLRKINEAQSIEALSAARQFIQQASIFGIINSLDLTKLYKEADVKAGLIYDQCLLLDRDSTKASEIPFFSLFYTIERNADFFLMIDGHNVLFALDDIFGGYYENGHPAKKARSKLEEKLGNVFVKDGADVILYYDSPTADEVNLSSHLRVKYSGGEGDHRADNAILKDMAYYRKLNATKVCCLVTKDRDLATQALELGSFVIDPEELALVL
jgi:predicted  nucleic acid-binding Zn-ribbon protein